MRRLAALVLCTLAFGAACGESSAAAATVNGTAISTQDLVDELNAIQANPDFIASLEQGSPGQTGAPTGGITVVGTTPGSFDAAFVAQVLLRQIDYSLIHAEVARKNLSADDACRLEARNDVFQNLGSGDANAGEQLFNKFPGSYQDLLLQRDVDVFLLDASLSEQVCGQGPDAAGYYSSHPEEFTRLCISLIAVSDEATAESVVAQARAGGDFAALAQEFSIDPESKDAGGAIGCRLPSEFNPTVAALLQAAQTGDVLDPLPGQGGVSIVKVTDRQLASLDEVQTQAEELASANFLRSLTTWIHEARDDAEVTIDPRYGTFDAEAFQINPPALDLNSSSPSSSDTP